MTSDMCSLEHLTSEGADELSLSRARRIAVSIVLEVTIMLSGLISVGNDMAMNKKESSA